MEHKISAERLAGAVARAHHHWEVQRDAHRTGVQEPVHSWTIALSRESGVGSRAIAKELSQRLDWPLYDYELLVHIAKELGLRTQLLESVDEKRISWFRECLQGVMGTATISESSYVRHLIETILSLGAHGKCIILGRGAPHILPSATTLRVRLVAPLKDRSAAVALELGMSREEATNQVDKKDRERAQFIKDHFHLDTANPASYDLVLNTARFSSTECANMILEALHRILVRRPTAAAPVL